MKIIYTQNNQVSVIHPTDEWLANNTIEDLAKKDVPPGVQYKIVEDSDIPTDRTYRDAWVLDSNDEIEIDAVKKADIDKELNNNG